jgi:EAL domain-containing protein (putative c-di-GMP-specific phosphodiesterase class I)
MMAIVAADVGHWQNAGLLVEQVSLNVSTADFYTGSLAKKVSETFSKAGIGLNKIVLEISEDVYLGRNDRVVAREIEVLRAAGVRVALDDFGTGYASLTHLVNVPVDIIKIDRAFVARLWPDDPSTIIVEGLIEIARRLGVAVVAVGIETEVQASQLWAMGCALGQGYAFAYPADHDATSTLLYRHAASGAGTSPLYANQTLSRPNERVSKRRTSVA